MRDLDQIRADRRPLVYVSDGTSGSDRVGRLLNDIAPLCDEVKVHREQLADYRAVLRETTESRSQIARERDEIRARADRLAATVRKLAGWAGHDIADLIDEGYLEPGDL